MTRRMLAPALAALLLLAACSSNTPTSSTAAPAPTSAAAAPPSAAAATPTPTFCPAGRLPSGACAGDPSRPATGLYGDRTAWEVCPLILQASTADRKNPDKMEPLGEKASAAQDVGLSTQGKLLADGARLARAAKAQGDATKFVTALAGYADAMAVSCTKAGFKP